MYKRRIWLIAVTALVVSLLFLLSYNLLFGILLPWSPVKPGFRAIPTDRTMILLPKNSSTPGLIHGVDEMVRKVEQLHGLAFSTRIKMVLLPSREEFSRYAPLSIKAGQTLQTGTVIYIPLDARDSLNTREELVMHGLSHAVLYQNTSLLNAFRIPGWLREGIANYHGTRSWNYPPEEFQKLATDRLLFNTTARVGNLRSRMYTGRFLHSEYRYLVEYIAHTYGNDRLTEYVKAVIKEPSRDDVLFQEVFNATMVEVAGDFRSAVLSREWPR